MTYRHHPDSPDRVGLVEGGRALGLPPGVALVDLLGDDGRRLAAAADRVRDDPDEVVDLSQLRLRAPIPRPPAVRDFSAFEQHVASSRRARGLEMDPDWYERPVFYFSNPHGVVGSGDEVAAPPGCAELDFELEVAAVVGRPCRDLTPSQAEDAIAGFTIMNDWSARDLQRREMRLGLGPAKGKDFATTLGPALVTRDELAPHRAGKGYDLTMTAAVNGRRYARANLGDLHWSFGEMLAYASRGAWVGAGDVLGSGTAGGGCILELSSVGGSDRYPWLQPGDEVTLTVDVLGTVANRVVTGGDA